MTGSKFCGSTQRKLDRHVEHQRVLLSLHPIKMRWGLQTPLKDLTRKKACVRECSRVISVLPTKHIQFSKCNSDFQVVLTLCGNKDFFWHSDFKLDFGEFLKSKASPWQFPRHFQILTYFNEFVTVYKFTALRIVKIQNCS